MKTYITSLIKYNSAFGYAGYFVHARSGLNLTVHRAYDSTLARFINRDPIGELGGVNLYGYVGAYPIDGVDPSGEKLRGGYSTGAFLLKGKIISCFSEKRPANVSVGKVKSLVDDVLNKITNEDVDQLKKLGHIPSDITQLNPSQKIWIENFSRNLSPDSQYTLHQILGFN